MIKLSVEIAEGAVGVKLTAFTISKQEENIPPDGDTPHLFILKSHHIRYSFIVDVSLIYTGYKKSTKP